MVDVLLFAVYINKQKSQTPPENGWEVYDNRGKSPPPTIQYRFPDNREGTNITPEFEAQEKKKQEELKQKQEKERRKRLAEQKAKEEKQKLKAEFDQHFKAGIDAIRTSNLPALKASLNFRSTMAPYAVSHYCDEDAAVPTLLHCAAKHGNVEALDLVLSTNNFFINAYDKNKRTPLHCASSNNHIDAVNRLLRVHGVDANIQSTTGRTPLHEACYKCNAGIARALINKGASIEIKENEENRTVLLLATELEQIDIVKLLVKSGANINAKRRDGKDVLAIARSKRNKDVYKYLKDHIAKKNYSDVIKEGRKLEGVISNIHGATFLRLYQQNSRLARR